MGSASRSGERASPLPHRTRGSGSSDLTGAFSCDGLSLVFRRFLTTAAEVYLLRIAKGEWRCRFDVVEVLMTPRGQVLQVDLLGGAFSRPER